MKRVWKRTLAIVSGIAVIIAIAAAIAFVLFDINSYKSKIETAASESTGLEVRIKGKLVLSFSPIGLSATDIYVSEKGSEILSIERLVLRAEPMPLLKKQFKITECTLVRPTVTIVKDAAGGFNFESSAKKPLKNESGTAFGLHKIILTMGGFEYRDQKTGNKIALNGINCILEDFTTSDSSENLLKNLSFTGRFDCKEWLQKDLRIGNIKGSVIAAKEVFTFNQLTADVLGGTGEGDLAIAASAIGPSYKLNVNISKLDFEKLEELFGTKKVIGGKGDLSASLTVIGAGSNRRIDVNGTFALRGDNLVTYTMDLDKVLSKYKISQEFHPVDLVGFFIVGPLSIVALKGYRYGDLYRQAGEGHGDITRFISHWRIRNNVAEAADCALATRNFRAALKGRLDFVKERYDDVTVALLDNAGCPTYQQTVTGPFNSPHASAVSTIESLAGPIYDLYKKAKRFAEAGRCEAFYSGSVQQPH